MLWSCWIVARKRQSKFWSSTKKEFSLWYSNISPRSTELLQSRVSFVGRTYQKYQNMMCHDNNGAYPNIKYTYRKYANTLISLDAPTKLAYLRICDLRFGPRGPLVDYFCDRYTNTQIYVRPGPIHVVSTRGEEFSKGYVDVILDLLSKPWPSRQPHITATECCDCHCCCWPLLRAWCRLIAAAITAAVARCCYHCCRHCWRSCHWWRSFHHNKKSTINLFVDLFFYLM